MENRIIKNDDDLFGGKIIKENPTRTKFIEPPFTVIDTKSGNWQGRKRAWKNLGIKSEVGRDVALWKGTNSSFAKAEYGKTKDDVLENESVFDPALCEILYNWYCPTGGSILDPFAGGSVRGIVANYLGFKYTGIDIRQEQVDSNRSQAVDILEGDNQPIWHVGDSNKVITGLDDYYDLVFSCPPYADLEVYSDLPGDISNMKYPEFIKMYGSIIDKSCSRLKDGGYAIFVVGEVRNPDKKAGGAYYGFVPDTIDCFIKAGMIYYNEAILLNAIGTAMLRANNIFVRGDKKLVKTHQNILIFKKPVVEFSLD